MRRIRRIAILGAATGLLALGLGSAATPASASAGSPTAAPITSAADYTTQKWYEIFAYDTLEECQDAGREQVEDPDTPWTAWYCEIVLRGGHWFYMLYLWQD